MDATMRKLADSTESFGSRLAVINERATTINLACDNNCESRRPDQPSFDQCSNRS
jgi:hypothetical protein